MQCELCLVGLACVSGGREGGGILGRVERVWDVKDGVWQLFTANTILAHGYVFQPCWKITSK